MTGILTTAAGVLLAAYIYRNIGDPTFRRHLLLWWVVIPLMIIVCLAILGSKSSKADTLGLGITSCVDVAKDYKKNPMETKRMYYTWFAGFASGVNVMSDRQKNLNVNFDTRWAQLARYCNEHPLGYFQDAAKFVVLDLPYKDDDKPPVPKFK